MPQYQRPQSYLSMLYQLVRIGTISKGLYQWATSQSKQVQKQTYNKYKNVKPNKPKGKPKPRKPKADLAKKVKKIEQQMKVAMGTLNYKYISSTYLRSSQNACAYTDVLPVTTGLIEANILPYLKYFNPSTPGTLITTDFTSGIFSKEVLLNIYASILLRNNYHVPCVCDVYLCGVKNDTDVAPSTYVTDGLTDIGLSSPSTNIVGYPTMSDSFMDNYKIVKHSKIKLKAGEEAHLSHNTGKFTYNPQLVDIHNLSYQKEYKSFVYLVRVQGVVGHDNTTSTQIGVLAAGVDMLLKLNATVEYNAGADITYTIVGNYLSTMTGTPIVSTPDVESESYTLT